MPTPAETMKALAALAAAEPALEAALRSAANAEQFAQIAVACAQRHGRTLDPADLQAHFRAQTGRPAAGRPGAEVTDSQLAGVAGGGMHVDDPLSLPRDRPLSPTGTPRRETRVG